MAQSGYTPIIHYYSITSGHVPTTGNLNLGEIAINVADQKVFMLNSASNAVVTLVGTLGNQNSNSVSITGGSIDGTTVGATTASSGKFTTLSASTSITNSAFSTAGVVTNNSSGLFASSATLSGTYGGTGVNNGSSTITIGGNVTMSGAYTFTGTLTANTSVTFPTSGTLVNSSVTSLSSLATVGTITSGTWNGSTIGVGYGGTGATSFTAGQILFGNGSSAINSNSTFFWDNTNYRLGIGTNSPSYSLDINAYQGPIIRLYDSYGVPEGGSFSTILFAGQQAPSGFAQINVLGVGYSGGVGQIVIQTNNGSGLTGGVTFQNGATSWSSYSDPKLKNVTGTYTTPLTDIVQIKPIKFTWKSDTTNKPCVGLDATTVQTVVPEAVSSASMSKDDKTEYLTVSYTEVIPLCVASIQALITEIETLKTQVSALTPK